MRKILAQIILMFILVGVICDGQADESLEASAKRLAQDQLLKNDLKAGIWDQNFLLKHPQILSKLRKYQAGKLCRVLRDLDNAHLTREELSNKLKKGGYHCYKKPISVDPKAFPLKYLKRDGSHTSDRDEATVVWQEICADKREGCALRIKMDGFPGTIRSQPHSTKAILMNADEDPSNYDNEAFKITSNGVPIPKGPSAQFGLSPCPYECDKGCKAWIDEIMAAAHPNLTVTSMIR